MTTDEILAAIALKNIVVNNLFQQQLLRGEKDGALDGRRWASNLRTTYTDGPTTWYRMGYGDTIEEALNAAYQNMLDHGGKNTADELPRFIRTGPKPEKRPSLHDL